MLGSKKSGGSVAGATTLISRETEIVGDIHFSGNLDVEGQVRGSILALSGKEALVRVVDKGHVEGEIRAPAVVINGQVSGNVHAGRHLELASKARVEGDVYYTLVEMAVGAEVNGRLMHVEGTDAGEVSRESKERPGFAGEEPATAAAMAGNSKS